MKPGSVAAAITLGWLSVAAACGAQDQGRSPVPTTSASRAESSPSASKDDFLTVPTGERLHYRCEGAGSPAVLIEAGTDSAGTLSFPSAFIEPLAAATTVCTYDRPGTGASSKPPDHARALDDQCAVEDELISGLRLPAPYVLMGQSGGGNIVIWCAARHPRKVAALVTIEAYHDAPAKMRKEDHGWRGPGENVDYVEVAVELDRMRMPVGDFPVLVFSATRADPGGPRNQRYWLDLSPHSRQVIVEGGHDLHVDAPDKLTPEILDLLTAVRAARAGAAQ